MQDDGPSGSPPVIHPEAEVLFEPALPPLGVLSSMSDRSRADLAKHGGYQIIPAGTEMIREGALQNRFYVVIKGELTISTLVSGMKTHLSVAKEGECIGETNLLEPGPASATVEVVKEATVWSMDIDNLRAFLTEHAEGAGALLIGIASCLSQRLRLANQLIAQHHVAPVEMLPEGRERAITSGNTPVQLNFFERLRQSLEGHKKIRISTKIKM